MAKAKKSASPQSDTATIFDNYVIVEIYRSEAKNAPYNPRILSASAREKLQKGIDKFKLLGPPIWNRKTGNIVGGHQRLSILDSLAGTKDYRLKVAAVELNDKQEREANILLNNPNAQGDWDIEKLGDLLKDPEIDIAGTGFGLADIYRMFGDAPFLDSAERAETLAAELREARERWEKITSAAQEEASEEFYIVVIFEDGKKLMKFFKILGLEANRYQDARDIIRHFPKALQPSFELTPKKASKK